MVHKNGETFNLKSSTNKRTSRQLHNASNELRPSLKDIVRMNIEENFLLASTIAAVTLGISSGFIIRSLYEFNDNETKYFGFIGQIFLRMLKFLILPLIAFRSIINIRNTCKYFCLKIILIFHLFFQSN
jgi:L-cystine uptake protein TcyP (sodium:dicarboxylate symporter family)